MLSGRKADLTTAVPRWHRSGGRCLRTPQRCLQRCGSSAAVVPVRSREAQPCRPARAARFVLL